MHITGNQNIYFLQQNLGITSFKIIIISVSHNKTKTIFNEKPISINHPPWYEIMKHTK